MLAALAGLLLCAGPAAAATAPPQPCIAPAVLDPYHLQAAQELQTGLYYAALADFETHAAQDEACIAGWCAPMTADQARVMAGFAYAGSAAAYYGYGEPDHASYPLTRAGKLFVKVADDPKAGALLLDSANAGMAWVNKITTQQQPVAPPLCTGK